MEVYDDQELHLEVESAEPRHTDDIVSMPPVDEQIDTSKRLNQLMAIFNL